MSKSTAKASTATEPKATAMVKETTDVTYDVNTGLVASTTTDDGQTSHFCYYAVKASEGKADRSDNVPALATLLSGLKLEKDDADLPITAMTCPQVPDASTPPLLAQCSYLRFPDTSKSEMSMTLYGYAQASKNSQGVLIPDTVLSLEGVTVDTTTTPWTLTKAEGRDGLMVSLIQVSYSHEDGKTTAETTSTRWYKNNDARQTQKLTETTTFDANTATLSVKSVAPFERDGLNLTATLSQHIRSARSGRVLRETEQDDLGRPTTMDYRTYDARGRLRSSSTYAWKLENYASGDANGTDSAPASYEWLDTSAGTWVVATGPDGRKGRTLLDGLQRPVRRELQREAGSDDAASNYVCLEEIAYGYDGEIQSQCTFDYHPGGLCLRNEGISLPANVRDWFWQAEAQDDKVEEDGTQTQRTETITGSLLQGTLHSVEHTQKNQADGQVTFALNHKRWNAKGKQLKDIGLCSERRVNKRGQTELIIEKVDTVTREWKHEYDEVGRRTQTKAPDGSVVKWAFQGLSNIPTKVSIKDAAGKERQLGKQTLRGDGKRGDEIVSRTVGADGSSQTYLFKNSGYQRPDGSEVWNESSEDGTSVSWYSKPKQTAKAGTLLTKFTYNKVTQAINAERPEATANLQSRISTQCLSPRLLGQVNTTRTLRGQTYREGLRHSLRGNVELAELSNGVVSRAWHDAQNRRTRVRRGQLEYRYRYTALGDLEQLFVSDRQSGQKLLVAYEYDPFGRETQRTYQLNGEIKSRYEQGWSVTGQLVSKTWYRDGASKPTRSETYTYEDKRSELKTWSVNAAKGYEIQDANRKDIKDQAYTYDALGNMLTCTTTYLDGSSEARTYTYGDKLKPTQRTQVTVTHIDKDAKADAPTILKLTSDDNGSLTENAAGHQLGYTLEGQLQSVKTDATLLASYEYDHIGRLASQWDESKQQRRVLQYTGDQLCGEIWLDAQNNPLRQRVLDEEAGLVVQCRELAKDDAAAKTYFILSDPQNGGGEEYSIDANGQWKSASIGFTPWGEAPLDSLNALGSGLGYNGQRVDPVTGAYHLGNGYRIYDPRHQAFFQGDSLSPFGAGGLNDRAYCAGRDPVNWHDPSGHIMVSRREQATQLASMDDMIRDTTPPQHEPVAWWEWLLLVYGTLLFVGLSIITGGAFGALMLAATLISFGFGVAELALRQSNPALSVKMGWASVATGFLDGAVAGAVKVGSSLARGLQTLSRLRSALRFTRLPALHRSRAALRPYFPGKPMGGKTQGLKIFGNKSNTVQKVPVHRGQFRAPEWHEEVISNNQTLWGSDMRVTHYDIQEPIIRIGRRNSLSDIHLYSGAHGNPDGDNWTSYRNASNRATYRRDPYLNESTFFQEDLGAYKQTQTRHRLRRLVTEAEVNYYNYLRHTSDDYKAIRRNLRKRKIHIHDLRGLDLKGITPKQLNALEAMPGHHIGAFCYSRNDERWVHRYGLAPVISHIK
nr:RHS repeat-associated core domain-containing protein [uncultured Pseudomonas sp.]